LTSKQPDMRVVDVRSYSTVELPTQWLVRVTFNVPYESREHCWEFANVTPPVNITYGRRLAILLPTNKFDIAQRQIERFMQFWKTDDSCAKYQKAYELLRTLHRKLPKGWTAIHSGTEFRLVSPNRKYERYIDVSDLAVDADDLAQRILKKSAIAVEGQEPQKKKRDEAVELATQLRKYFKLD